LRLTPPLPAAHAVFAGGMRTRHDPVGGDDRSRFSRVDPERSDRPIRKPNTYPAICIPPSAYLGATARFARVNTSIRSASSLRSRAAGLFARALIAFVVALQVAFQLNQRQGR
jgi:hypothetical protein